MGSKLQGAISVGVLALVILVVLLETYAVVVPTASAASDDMNDSNRCVTVGCFYNSSESSTAPCRNASGNDTSDCTAANQTIPLGNLFNATGFVYILVIVGLLLLAIRGFMPGKK